MLNEWNTNYEDGTEPSEDLLYRVTEDCMSLEKLRNSYYSQKLLLKVLGFL